VESKRFHQIYYITLTASKNSFVRCPTCA